MNSLKLITISCAIITSFTLLMLINYFLTKNFKSKLNNDGKLKISFAIWYAAMFLAGANIISSIISTIFEVIDNLVKIQPTKFYFELIKAISLVIGIGFIWFMLWFLVIKFLSKIIPIKADENEEMEEDNYGYFLVKGIMLIGLIFSLSPVLSLILRALIPNVEIPFYH
ncbi:hypothetical protein FA048_03865 [Pedobacter polaris]|uniref:Uncharacterized protein n=1 Tax=Pedobacter polaris TaxID=2571273 RepID=A0A4U1CWR7_9SPHI|nr:hypothetical protein [Pedobacter polaris]TKC12765.1 hypothetical protein FA048_03865 [Pedobacter polaris]